MHLNTTVVPRLRVAGFALLSLSVLLHNRLVLGQPAWTAWAELTFVLALYCATSWYALHLFFVDLRRHFDLGALVLAGDIGMFSLVTYATGGERSWLFFLPMFRVADQTVTSFRRALAFAHLAPIGYVAVIVYIILIDGRRLPLRSGDREGPRHLRRQPVHRADRAHRGRAPSRDVEGDSSRPSAHRRSRPQVGRARGLVA